MGPQRVRPSVAVGAPPGKLAERAATWHSSTGPGKGVRAPELDRREAGLLRMLLIVAAAAMVAAPGALSVAAAASSPSQPGVSDRQALTAALASPSASPSISPSASPSASPSPADVTPPVTVATGADARWHSSAVTVRLGASDDASGVASTFYKLDARGWTLGRLVVVPAPRDHSFDGVHTVTFYSVDNAGNPEPQQAVTVRIDTTPSRLSWLGVSPGVIYRTQTVRLRFVIGESTGAVRVGVAVTDQYGHCVRRLTGLRRDPGSCRVDLVPTYGDHRPFVPGLYRVRLTLVDQAGNVTVTKPRSFRDFRPASARAYFGVPGAGRRVALTFDDSGDGPWSSILRTLKAYRSHATFFVLGPSVNARLARRTLADGNAVGSHGWTHSVMTREGYNGVRRELIRSIAPWWAAAGAVPVPYCRPPYGSFNRTTLAAAGSAGFTRVVLWDVDPRDWTGPGSGVIAQRVLSHIHPGAIVCMHLRAQTAAALPAILRGLHARGYKAVSVPELFRAAGSH
jgi:peptidoglycan-N-acetylglucosamine deacetylase